MTIAFATLVLLAVLYLAAWNARDVRDRDDHTAELAAARSDTYALRADHAAHLMSLREEHATERDAWMRERQLLLNRIKPEAQQYVPLNPNPEIVQAVNPEDDTDYWASTQGLTREQLAEREFAAELAARNGTGL